MYQKTVTIAIWWFCNPAHHSVWRDVSDVEVELGLGGVGQDFDELLDQQEVEFRYQDIESLEVLLSGKVNLLS